jgi:hypothetical protein
MSRFSPVRLSHPAARVSARSEVEDGLAELFDLVGARGQLWQCIEGEAGVGVECVGIGRVEAGEARHRQPVTLFPSL